MKKLGFLFGLGLSALMLMGCGENQVECQIAGYYNDQILTGISFFWIDLDDDVELSDVNKHVNRAIENACLSRGVCDSCSRICAGYAENEYSLCMENCMLDCQEDCNRSIGVFAASCIDDWGRGKEVFSFGDTSYFYLY